MIGRWGTVLTLLLLALGSGWLLEQLEPDAPERPSRPAHSPDFFMENFTTTSMDETGRPRHRLQAEHMEHFPDTDTNELERPYLTIYRLNEVPWHVRSERGWISADQDEILLLGEVHIWRDDERGEREVDIKTRDLRVLPDTQYGETDEPVTITTRLSQSKGVGMHAYLAERRIQLLSAVHTRYENKHENERDKKTN